MVDAIDLNGYWSFQGDSIVALYQNVNLLQRRRRKRIKIDFHFIYPLSFFKSTPGL